MPARVDATLATEGATGDADARVTRTRDGLVVELTVPPTLDHGARSRAAVRVVGALREFDRHAPRIDVSFADPPAPFDSGAGADSIATSTTALAPEG